MTSEEIRSKFLEYFKSRDHAIVQSSSLIPDDPSVLLTAAGMQQFKKYYTREADPLKDFSSLNTASIQKSFRMSDIDEVGDESHLTFFEMLGNFSFGGYFKKEAINFAHEFITKEMGLEISYVSIFEGSPTISKDEESKKIWTGLGVKEIREEGMEDVFWGPTGIEGPCGPATEIYCKNADGKDIEIWNIVFNQFFYPGGREELLGGKSGKKLKPLEHPGVDTGMGLERLAMAVNKTATIFETDLFAAPFRGLILNDKGSRVVADHIRAAAFLLGDGVRPSNKSAGYILRRVIRRMLIYAQRLSLSPGLLEEYIENVVMDYGVFYGELLSEKNSILAEFKKETDSFSSALEKGLKEFNKLYPPREKGEYDGPRAVTGKDAFDLYQSYGFPGEVIKELAVERGYIYDTKEFRKEFEAHQKVSRAGVEKKFGGHGLILDTGELKAKDETEMKKVIRLHTATHLLQQALRETLGAEVAQAGSDITADRTRFDFTFGRKVTPVELKVVEDTVNKVIAKDLPVRFAEMPIEDAKKTGALFFFKQKYPEKVKVYFVGPSIEGAFSKEFCGGPHVAHTGEIGKFRIVKEESASARIRRIRAVVE